MPFTERFTESFKEIAQNFFNNTFINIFPKMRFKRARELHALDALAEASRAATKKRLLETAAAGEEDVDSVYMTGKELFAAKEVNDPVLKRVSLKRASMSKQKKVASRESGSDTPNRGSVVRIQ